MSNFDEEKDYDLDYFSSNKETSKDETPEEESFDLNAFSSSFPDSVDDSAFSVGEDTESDDGEVSFSNFGKKRKEVKKDNAKLKKAKVKKTLKVVGKAVLSFILIAVITGCLVVGAFAVYVFNFVDDTVYEDLDELKLDFTTTLYVYDEEKGDYVEYQRLHGEENRIWVGFDEIPENLKNAFVAVEDKRFRDHSGVDWKRTVSAFANMFIDLYSSNQGGSTITQQLVKNLTDDRDQTAMRKIREIMRARYLESEYEKDTILECYLNTICLAGGMYGVEVASNYYFGKSTSELTLVECASLASLAKEPEKYRPDRNPNDNKKRRNTVLYLMHEQGYISDAEYEEAKATELTVVADKSAVKSKEVNSYYVDAVIEEVIDRLVEEYDFDESYAAKNFYNGGYKIYCTVNPEVQKTLEDEYAKTSKYFTSKSTKDGKTVQSAMTIMDYEGHIVGIVGGGGEKTGNREFNRATMSYRQPGSTMKPLAAYSQALQKNLIHYSKIVEDSPLDKYYPSGAAGPKNWYGYYRGGVTVAKALECSINTIPCKLVKEMGVESTYYYLNTSLGIELNAEQDMNLSSMGLGGTYTGITTTQSAASFAVFGNLGNYYEPTTFTLMTDQHDNVVLKQGEGVQAMDENTACIMNHLLQNVVYGTEGTGTDAGAFSTTMKCYAKTGTSSEANDCWFVGGTPYYIASCWFGYDQSAAVYPSSLARRMWTNVMKTVHSKLEPKDFEQSEFVTRRHYCLETGLLATDKCTKIAEGYYKTTYSLPAACTAHPGTLLPEIVDLPEGEEGEGGTTTPNPDNNGNNNNNNNNNNTQTPAPTPTPDTGTGENENEEQQPNGGSDENENDTNDEQTDGTEN